MRRIITGLILLACIAIISFSLHQTVVPNHIDKTTFKAIKQGMTYDEVVALFGVPPGDYTTKRINYDCPPAPPYRPWAFKNPATTWASDEIKVRIHFDDDNRVVAMIDDWIWPDESVLGHIRGWFHQH